MGPKQLLFHLPSSSQSLSFAQKFFLLAAFKLGEEPNPSSALDLFGLFRFLLYDWFSTDCPMEWGRYAADLSLFVAKA